MIDAHDIEVAVDAAQDGAAAMARAVRVERDRQAIAHDLFDKGRRYAEIDVLPVLVACDTLIEALAPRLPDLLFDHACPDWVSARRECEIWADCAPPSTVTAMLVACITALQGLDLGKNPRKRMFVALWNSLTPEDRKAFLDKIAKGAPQ